MAHVVLLGDSIFDNALYVPRGESIIQQLRSRLGRGDRATLLAVDGAVISSVAKQLEKLPEDTTHLVLSVGGNNALEEGGLLSEKLTSAQDGFSKLARIQYQFAAAYRHLLRDLRSLGRPVVVCTIYDAIPGLPREAVTALSAFNDSIIRAAIDASVPINDLRFVCNDARDFSELSPIEPSEIGGAKIAASIAKIVGVHDFTRGETVVYR